MRIDVYRWSKMRRPAINVRLNGITQHRVTIADEEREMVERHIFPYKLCECGGTVTKEKLYGTVQIILGDNARK